MTIVAIVVGSLLSWWDWKALIGWRALVEYIKPENATQRKDTVQVYALVVAGAIAAITAAVGLTNLYFSRRNLEQQQEALRQQRKLEARRAQDTALQAYYQQVGQLLIEHNLFATEREDIKLLVRAQTLTVLRELDGQRKEGIVVFLYGAQLINGDEPIINLEHADLTGVNLNDINLWQVEQQKGTRVSLVKSDLRKASFIHSRLNNANLEGTDLRGATFHKAILPAANLRNADIREQTDLTQADLRHAVLMNARLNEADLQGAKLTDANLARATLKGANLTGADLTGADLTAADFEGATVTEEQLSKARSLRFTKMPDGSRPDAS